MLSTQICKVYLGIFSLTPGREATRHIDELFAEYSLSLDPAKNIECW